MKFVVPRLLFMICFEFHVDRMKENATDREGVKEIIKWRKKQKEKN
jgi:hypothetical protein